MIEGVNATPPLRPSATKQRSGTRFAVTGPDEVAAAGGLGDVGAVALGGMLAMQEAETDATQDRDARRDGENLLLELSSLQRDLLYGAASETGLTRLTELSARARTANDKALQDVLNAIGLRAKVELARYATDAERSQP